ncbi:hypothetical protein GM661_00065 [Iocasia frigidifontis]|uniref:Uncharacterized protein n=1 Tax=Iocasia fonsfrigidae TaxID=2682810 RepID=A0A8A7K5N9_9FIRM|nr:CLC_0170 family protein [Iocasia fonsfrigidae]QTL96480.1 hypothetical protein GM661_00065 [Iocasia fonsfrigidae]
MIDFLINVLDYIAHNIYSPYLVFLFIISGLLSFFIDTDYAHFYANYKDYIFSFFFGLLNISIGIILLLLNILHTRYIF